MKQLHYSQTSWPKCSSSIYTIIYKDGGVSEDCRVIAPFQESCYHNWDWRQRNDQCLKSITNMVQEEFVWELLRWKTTEVNLTESSFKWAWLTNLTWKFVVLWYDHWKLKSTPPYVGYDYNVLPSPLTLYW
jgi:hypothetical protein